MSHGIDFSKKMVQEHQSILTVSYMFLRQRSKFVWCYDYEKSVMLFYLQKNNLQIIDFLNIYKFKDII